MICDKCNETLPTDTHRLGLYGYVAGKVWCAKCQKEEIEKLAKKRNEVVSKCPDCGAPIYGEKDKPALQNRYCSGDLYYDLGNFVGYTCNCREKRTAVDLMRLENEKLRIQLEHERLSKQAERKPGWKFWA